MVDVLAAAIPSSCPIDDSTCKLSEHASKFAARRSPAPQPRARDEARARHNRRSWRSWCCLRSSPRALVIRLAQAGTDVFQRTWSRFEPKLGSRVHCQQTAQLLASVSASIIRPHRLAIANDIANTLPAVVSKTTYAGSHTKFSLRRSPASCYSCPLTPLPRLRLGPMFTSACPRSVGLAPCLRATAARVRGCYCG